MKQVTVTAVRAFEHAGRSYGRGEAVTVPALDAATLARAGHVSLGSRPAVKTRALKAEASEPSADGPAKPRRYRRRDLVAEE